MANITIGTKLRAVKTGLIATVADVNAKYKTAFVEFDDHTNASYSLSTLKDKRRFVVVTNDDDAESVQKQEYEDLEVISEEYVEDSMTENAANTEINGVEIKEASSSTIDSAILAKFVKRAQKIITQAMHDSNGYHVAINVDGKEAFYHDKSLQNIRSAIGHVYRGEVTI